MPLRPSLPVATLEVEGRAARLRLGGDRHRFLARLLDGALLDDRCFLLLYHAYLLLLYHRHGRLPLLYHGLPLLYHRGCCTPIDGLGGFPSLHRRGCFAPFHHRNRRLGGGPIRPFRLGDSFQFGLALPQPGPIRAVSF